jgi:hypothetical protein
LREAVIEGLLRVLRQEFPKLAAVCLDTAASLNPRIRILEPKPEVILDMTRTPEEAGRARWRPQRGLRAKDRGRRLADGRRAAAAANPGVST